ncbi:hypothetical protein ACIPK7_05270 [Pseudomonas sp. NPDC086581]|uniref:hypothetical protein n=1 Tax=Pseudomonas sp. NPDC086581 TaxID=3364432 RepID=UPI0037F500C3
MLIFAQVEGQRLVQFVAFNVPEVAEVHFSAFPEAMFIQTDFFGSPATHCYNPDSGTIEARPPAEPAGPPEVSPPEPEE